MFKTNAMLKTKRSWLKRGMLVGGVATAMLFGCGNNQQVKNSSSSGSLALSNDDTMLYAVDTDNGVVSVVDTKANSKLYDVPVGTRPMKVTVGSDDTVFVANRGSRSVSVIRKGERQVSAELSTGVDPTGMAVSFDGKTLYVVSATAKDNNEYGLIQAFDTATLEEKYAKPLGYEPRAIALVSNDKALVTEFKGQEKGADLIEVDLKTGEPMNAGTTGIYENVNFSNAGTNPGSRPASFQSRGQTEVVVSPQGNRAYVTTIWAREDNLTQTPNSITGYYSAGGPCSVGSVATAGIVTVDTGDNAPTRAATDDLTACASSGTNTNTEANFPPTAIGSVATNTMPAIQGPSAMAVDPTGEWIFMVNKETSNVAIMPAWRRNGNDVDFNTTGNSLRGVVAVNQPGMTSGADGIALTKDGRTAFVYNQFDHNIKRLGNSVGGSSSVVTVTADIQLGLSDTLPAAAVLGRRAFFDAESKQMSSEQTHVSCATCHLEGRDDGHVWGFTHGQVQTPSLVGRKTEVTTPMHWRGEFDDVTEFLTHTVNERMGGRLQPATQQNMLAWLNTQELPENPNKQAALTEAQARGQAAYVKAECNTCHSGENLTDRKMNAVSAINSEAFDTPSLRG
ncbi:MAG: hypothetical protein JNK82_15325, partial [Myxococcaceae bacterium]|nr:hypothetical protein [Myxococcaceae bacterium]